MAPLLIPQGSLFVLTDNTVEVEHKQISNLRTNKTLSEDSKADFHNSLIGPNVNAVGDHILKHKRPNFPDSV